ncbi:MAG: SIMPL domain-containing protein [Woeseiaceae bacterium]
MSNHSRAGSLLLAIGIAVGLIGMGILLKSAAIEYKQFERTVRVKGLSEQEFPADVVIWPIQFSVADNALPAIYASINTQAEQIREFLIANGIAADEITSPAPSVVDKTAQQYGGGPAPTFRYSGTQTVTVYSENVDAVRRVMVRLSELGERGIVFSGDSYNAPTEYLFTRLNEIKPQMIEEATRKAREVAEKFAADSNSQLGKIRRASQGQFSIYARDNNNPHIKRVRVVSTVEYYLSD